MKFQLNSKKYIDFYVYFLFTATIFTGFLSCNIANTSKEEDTVKQTADSKNEEKFTDVSTERDAMFVVESAAINTEEIALGNLAKDKTKTPAVVSLAKMMVEEHTKTADDLKALAVKKSITLPAPIANEVMESYKDLSKKSGKDFDKSYCDAMVEGHKKAIEKFEFASNNATDADIKAWAASVLPALKMHLQHSEDCKKKCAAI